MHLTLLHKHEFWVTNIFYCRLQSLCQSGKGHLDWVQLIQEQFKAFASFWLGPHACLAEGTCKLLNFENNSSQPFSFYGKRLEIVPQHWKKRWGKPFFIFAFIFFFAVFLYMQNSYLSFCVLLLPPFLFYFSVNPVLSKTMWTAQTSLLLICVSSSSLHVSPIMSNSRRSQNRNFAVVIS